MAFVFGKFGLIESVHERFINPKAYPHYFVQFLNEEDATTALESSRWNDGWIVVAADPLDQPDHPLQASPVDRDLTIVSKLNDHCIQKIFKHLDAFDLADVAEVCVRFNENAHSIFELKHKRVCFDFPFRHRAHKFEDVLNKFGTYIESININVNTFPSESSAIEMIAANCEPKLTSVTLISFNFNMNLDSLRPIFCGVRSLNLSWCMGDVRLQQLLGVCSALESLTLQNSLNITHHAFTQTFPDLRALSLNHITANEVLFQWFIIHHPNLTSISIESTMSVRALNVIGQHARNLQSLKFIQGYNSSTRFTRDELRHQMESIARLSSLTTVQINLGRNAIDAFMEALVVGRVPIRDLDLVFMGDSVDNVVACLSQLKQLKNIKLCTNYHSRRLTNAHAVSLAENLPQLEELRLREYHDSYRLYPHYQFESRLTMDGGVKRMIEKSATLKVLRLESILHIRIEVDDYNAMLKMIQKRSPMVPLKIEICGYSMTVNVPADRLEENRNLFSIKRTFL